MSETPTERADAARTRRRWISLAEAVAVAGVLIAALSLWANWSERREDAATKSESAVRERRAAAKLALTASVADDGRMLRLTDARYDIQEAAVAFPRPLGVPIQRTAAAPGIEAAGFADEILRLTDNGPDERTGRVPVLVSVGYLVDGKPRSHTAIYDVIWRTEGRMLTGRTLRLESLRLREAGGDQARVDALWTRFGVD